MKQNRRLLVPVSFGLLAAAIALIPSAVRGSAVGTLPTFTAGGSIRASDFNSAFLTLKTAIDDNNTRIGNLPSLTTTARADLVSAINEVNAKSVSGTGSQGPQGPAGPTKLTVTATKSLSVGGSTNQFTTGTALTQNVNGSIPVAKVASRPFTATLRIQTTNAAVAGGDTPGFALASGNLVVDIDWSFFSGANVAGTVTQTNVGTVALSNAANNDVTITVNGTVPAAPNTAGGFGTSLLSGPIFKVNGATTATGQAIFTTACDITPP